MRDKWTDERLDDLKESVDGGFKNVQREFGKVDQRFNRVDQRFERIDARLDGIAKAIVIGSITLSGVMLSGFIAIFMLIATRL